MSNVDKYNNKIFAISILIGLYYISTFNYVLFHSLAEMFSIVIAFGIYMFAWNSRRFLKNDYILFLGIAYLFIGSLDFIHTLAYPGMGVFEGGGSTNLAAQLWIASRYIESISLLTAFLFLRRKLNPRTQVAVYTIVTGFLLASILYWNIFPLTFVEGVGLTPFKKISEYLISLILLASLFVLYENKKKFDEKVFKLLASAIVVTVGAELAFTFYISAYGFSNLVGHYLKIISFYLIYKAVIEIGLEKPFRLLLLDKGDEKDEKNSV